MATLYFNNAVDTAWDTLGNWWTDAGCTSAAAAIPATGDTVIVVADATLGSAPSVLIQPASVQFVATGGEGWARNGADLTAFNCVIEFNGTSYNGDDTFVYGKCTNARFNGSSRCWYGGGGDNCYLKNASFHDSSSCNSIIDNVNVMFYDDSHCWGAYAFGANPDPEIILNDRSYVDGGPFPNKVTLNDVSRVGDGCYVTGPSFFNDSTHLGWISHATNPTFNDNSYNDGRVSGTATFNDNSYNTSSNISGTAIVRQRVSAFLAWRDSCGSGYVGTLELKFTELDVIGGGLT